MSDELDLTKVDAQVPPGLSRISTTPFDSGRFHEYCRISMAGALVFCVFIEIVLMFASFLAGKPMQEIKDIGQILFAPIIGLVGAVVGFYFGVEREHSANPKAHYVPGTRHAQRMRDIVAVYQWNARLHP